MSNNLIKSAVSFLNEAKDVTNHPEELAKHLKSLNVNHAILKHKNGDTSIIADRDPKSNLIDNQQSIDDKIRKMGYLNKYGDKPKPSNTFPHKTDQSKSVTYSYKSNKENELSTDNFRFKG